MNGNLVKTYHRDFIERRSRENLVGLCTEQEVDERIFETTVKRPVGILKNSPTRTTPASTPEGSAPSTSILKTSFQPLYQPYEERQPPFVQQPNYHQTNYPITYTQPYFHEQPRLPMKNTSYDFEGPRFQQNVYRPTTETQFASNLRTFLDEHIPDFVWIFLLCLQILLGLLSICIGTFNYPFCNAQPNIPVYLIVSGILLITNGSIRLCTYIPTPKSANRSTLMTDLCIYGLEGIILLGIDVSGSMALNGIYTSMKEEEYMKNIIVIGHFIGLHGGVLPCI
uniref:Uncharacterized protein n=1 Tax=Acrobeloides nanus TaxID=290746 RepID=A0A914CHY1_9BILA